MVIAAETIYKIGNIYQREFWIEGKLTPLTGFKVLREATHAEYLAFAKSINTKGRLADPDEYPYFYEISVD